MTKIPAPYLARRPAKRPGAADRFYFKPSDRHRAAGWKVVRLHDASGRPVVDELAAAAACRPLSDLYRDWLEGKANCTPDRIDARGHVRPLNGTAPPATPIVAGEKRYRPGTIGAIVADYLASKFFLTVKRRDGRRHPRPDSTRRSYRQCLAILVKDWGDQHWAQINRALARNWIEDIMDETPAFGHAIYRVARAVLGDAEFIYPHDWHPGHIPQHANPFSKLDIATPEAEPMPWPINLVRPMVEVARGAGQRFLAAEMVFNAWLGQRIGDIVALPADRFQYDRPLWLAQGKTGADVVLPWQKVPELLTCAKWLDDQRADYARTRKVMATTWLIDEATGKAFTVDRIRNVYNDVRDKLCASLARTRIDGEPRWQADYLVKAYDDDPFALDVSRLQLRAQRATAVTQLSNAGVSDIGAITGHSEDTLLKILKFYRARTATRAANAFTQRLTFEGRQ